MDNFEVEVPQVGCEGLEGANIPPIPGGGVCTGCGGGVANSGGCIGEEENIGGAGEADIGEVWNVFIEGVESIENEML